MRNLPRIRLGGLLVLYCAAVALLISAAVVPLILQATRDVTQRQATEVLRGRSRDASTQLARAIYAQWFKLQQLGQRIAKGEEQAAIRAQFDTIKLINPDCAWIGFANGSGKIVTASGGILEGEQALERPWFRAGVERPFAGDVHQALMLARFLAAKTDEPVRLVDLSMPVQRPDGGFAGVIAMHLDWTWVRDFLRAFGRDDGVDLMLISRDGDVLVGPRDIEGKRLTVHSILAAGQGVGVTDTEVWPDGRQYLVASVSGVTFRDLPSFGWSVVARQPVDLALRGTREIAARAFPMLLGVAAILLVGAFLLGRALAKPMVRLTLAAGDMARGNFSAPVSDERRYREVALLAAALTRLQSVAASRLADKPEKPVATDGVLVA